MGTDYFARSLIFVALYSKIFFFSEFFDTRIRFFYLFVFMECRKVQKPGRLGTRDKIRMNFSSFIKESKAVLVFFKWHAFLAFFAEVEHLMSKIFWWSNVELKIYHEPRLFGPQDWIYFYQNYYFLIAAKKRSGSDFWSTVTKTDWYKVSNCGLYVK